MLDLSSQYIQYRADLTTTDSAQTPSLEDIIITTGEAPVAVNDSFNVGQNRSRTMPTSGPGSLTFNDVDGDTPNDHLRVTAITPPSHGTASLNADGSVVYTPTLNYNGPDAFTYIVSDGLLTVVGIRVDQRDVREPGTGSERQRLQRERGHTALGVAADRYPRQRPGCRG